MYTLQCKYIYILFNSFYYLKFNDSSKNIFLEISISRETPQVCIEFFFIKGEFLFLSLFFCFNITKPVQKSSLKLLPLEVLFSSAFISFKNLENYSKYFQFLLQFSFKRLEGRNNSL